MKNKGDFALSDIILNHTEMTGAVIYGGQQTGKSMYSLKILYAIYKDWDTVFDHLFFRLEDLITFLEGLIKKTSRKRELAVVWDDAGVYGNKLLYFRKGTGRLTAERIQNLFDVMGTAVKSIILTTPNPENLLRAIRGYEFYRIKITRENQFNRRIATGYKSILLPSGTRRIRTVFKDHYDVKVDDEIYDRYYKIRETYFKEAVKNLGALVNSGVTGEKGDESESL